MPSTFRLQAKNLFLTYPQCSATKERLLEYLKDKFPAATYIVVCQEQHEDGSPHLHAMVCNEAKVRLSGANCLDFDGFHGKYEAARDIANSSTYIKKDGNFIEEGEAPAKKRKWAELESANSKEEYLSLVKEISPRDYCINLERIQYAAEQKFKTSVPEYIPRFQFACLPPAVEQWKAQMFDERPKSLVLWGATRTGKTQLARSLGRHMYWNGLFDIEMWDDSAKFAIFDDWDDWSKLFQWKCWIGAQEEFSITDKYRKKRRVKWGKPCIILSNHYPNFPDDAWLRGNTIILNVMGPLF